MELNFAYLEKLTEDQLDQLMVLYKYESWCKDRRREDVAGMLERCHKVGLIREDNGEIAAFARFFSDGVYRAAIYDVIVAKAYRGTGCGRLLLEQMVNHPLLHGVERVELYCKDYNVAFYEKFQFQKVPQDINLMWRMGEVS